MLQLDYGGFTDSRGRKVSVWSATGIKDGAKQEHFDFFFDGANQNKKRGQPGAKKNGKTGIFFLRQMLRQIEGTESLLRHTYPKVTHLILSGDTGNGFRGYAMLEELSTVLQTYGYSVELIPLAPGHAYNRTDSRIAHMNTFFKNCKSVAPLFGAYLYAQALRTASDPSITTIRKLQARSQVFFSVVEDISEDTETKQKNKGAQLDHPNFEKGHIGVRGLLYFDFSFNQDGGRVNIPGYARVRENGDPKKDDNLKYVYTWRKDLCKLMCQTCSDAKGIPVALSTLGCKKNACVTKARSDEEKDNVQSYPYCH